MNKAEKPHISGAPIGAVGYVEFKCRCPQCTAQYLALGANPRERRRNGPTPSWVHGTWNGYSNYACDCDRCLQACREKYTYSEAWRAANRSKVNRDQRIRRAAAKGITVEQPKG